MRLRYWCFLCVVLLSAPIVGYVHAAVKHFSRPALCTGSGLARSVGHSCALAQAGISPDTNRCYRPTAIQRVKPLLVTVTYSGMGGGPYLEFLLFEDGQAILDSDQSETGLLTWRLSEKELKEYKELIERLDKTGPSDLQNNIFCVTDLGATTYAFKKTDGTKTGISVEGSIGDSYFLMTPYEQSTFSYASEPILDIYYKTHSIPKSAKPWLPEDLAITLSPLQTAEKTDATDEKAVWYPSEGTIAKLLKERTIPVNEIEGSDYLALCNLTAKDLRAVIGRKTFAVELASLRPQLKSTQ